jgi:DNA-binding beta-propeller fold protein YncE
VSDLKDELRQLADDAASQARPLPVADVIRRADRRQRRTITGWRRGSAPAPGRRWPGWVAPLAAAAVVAATVIVPSALHRSGPAGGHRSAAATVYVSYPGKYSSAGELTPISTATNTPGKPIRMGTLGGLAFTPDGKTAYIEGPKGAVVPVSTATNAPGPPIHVPMPGYLPFSITMNPDRKTAYLTFVWSIGSKFSGSIVPISTASNTAGPPIWVTSARRPYVLGIVFSPDGKTAYVAAGSIPTTPFTRFMLKPATLTPINTATGTPGTPIRLSHGASNIAITPDGKTIYVDAGDGHRGYVTPVSTATGIPGHPIPVSTATGIPGHPIPLSAGAGTMTITPDGKTLYVAGTDTITPVSTATNTAAQPIPVAAADIAITPDGKTLYAAARHGVVPISTATNTPGQPIPVAADDIAITPDGKTLYAAARHGVVPISTTTNIPGKPIHPPDYRGIPRLWITP